MYYDNPKKITQEVLKADLESNDKKRILEGLLSLSLYGDNWH